MEYEIKPAGKFSLNLKELWDYRELLYFFAWRDVKVKYKQAYLGILWVLLQPLVMMIIFTLFFGKVLKVPSDGISYPIFVYSGMMFWTLFSSGLSSSGDSMVSNANIIKKIYFPRLLVPIAAILVSMFDFIITFILFIILLIYQGQFVNLTRFFLFIPISFCLVTLTTCGLGTFFSALNVKYRDFRYIIPFLIQFTMFVTPVIYPVSIIPYSWAKYVMALNPLSGAITLSRSIFTNNSIDVDLFAISVLSAIVLFIIGIATFRKTEAYFADLA